MSVSTKMCSKNKTTDLSIQGDSIYTNMSSVHIRTTMHLLLVILSVTILVTSIDCLHEDQIGKFDWRKQFIGIPKYIYHQTELNNLIVGTESNVIASLLKSDGSIIWRQLLPKGCHINHMSILKSSEDHRDYLIRTSCSSSGTNHSQIWNPQNGLLASTSRYKEIAEDETAESILAETSHSVEGAQAFTLSNHQSLIVTEDGQVSLSSHGSTVWTREESLATVTNVQIVTLPSDMRDKFGLKKVIVLLTQVGKIFGLDTLTGDVLWTLFDRELSTRGISSSALLIVTRQSEEEASKSRAIIVHPDGLVSRINPITGESLEKNRLPNSIRQVSQTEIDENDGSSGLIILDTQNEVHIVPKCLEAKVKENIHKYHMTVVERTPPRLESYKFLLESGKITPHLTWTFSINSAEKIVNLGIKRIDEEVHSPARVLGDRGILYKYLNPNLIAVMTEGSLGDPCAPDNYVNIYLIDGITGALVHSAYHPKARGPSKMVHSENWVVYSYYNTRSRRTEVSSLEMFEGATQTNSTTFSSITRTSIKPKLVEHKSFIFPNGIDAMVDTTTLRAMTNKHLIVAIPSGGLLEIPKIFLDPRRPINMLAEHREEGLVPYMPELPIPSESMINYDRVLLAVRKIVTSPAMLESTSLVFAYGLDLFFTRVTPSKTFDILKDDFDHLLITGVLIFLVVASYITKLLAQRKALRAAWK